MHFSVLASHRTAARAGLLQTEHGTVRTPTYMPVGTYGPIKLLDVEETRAAGASMVLGNALHLHETAGADRIASFGGLAQFTSWRGPTLTDSGGYQVSYMWQSSTRPSAIRPSGSEPLSRIEKITDEGAMIQMQHTGQRYLLTPELSMELQAKIGADIVMAFDQPTFDTDSLDAARTRIARTRNWIERSKRHWDHLVSSGIAPPWQSFMPIIQGGRHRELRRECARHVVDMDTSGVAIAGESIGIDPLVSSETLEMVHDLIPREKPLYAMGLGGGPEGFFEAVRRGVDLFDNTSPTRLARCGYALTSPTSGGCPRNRFRLEITKSRHADDRGPLDCDCSCKTCRTYSRAYLRHLFQIRDPLGMRLVTFHNVALMCTLSSTIHTALLNGTFDDLYNRWVGANEQ